VLFAGDAARLRVRLADGVRLRCLGTLTIYSARGTFQIRIRHAAPVGAGDLAAALEALKAKLEAEGLFSSERKRALPLLPRAVWGDVVTTIQRRFPVPIVLSPTVVQGEEAPRAILRALERIQRVREVDVVILGRGGGATEDLWPFNDEALARAIAACRVPVVSAVGHERDVTIADLVADVRAPTPTGAGELVVPPRQALVDRVATAQRRLERAARARISVMRREIERAERRVGRPLELLAQARQRLDDRADEIERLTRARLRPLRTELVRAERRLSAAHPRTRLARDRAALAKLHSALISLERTKLQRLRAAAERAAGKLDALSPLRVLARGYAIALHEPSGRALVDPAAAASGDDLTLVLSGGRLKAKVS
jgi:exodeoxyribonuclease VII large subunit